MHPELNLAQPLLLRIYPHCTSRPLADAFQVNFMELHMNISVWYIPKVDIRSQTINFLSNRPRIRPAKRVTSRDLPMCKQSVTSNTQSHYDV